MIVNRSQSRQRLGQYVFHSIWRDWLYGVTVKTLLLLRHGKSSWKQPDLPDHERPLTHRGELAAKRMGQLLRKLELIPDSILTSDAIRACETATRVATEASYAGELKVCADLYHADSQQLAEVVAGIPDQIGRVLVVGHNPGLSDWLTQLTGDHDDFPTAALACIELPLDSWRSLLPASRGKLHGIWRPRELDDDEH